MTPRAQSAPVLVLGSSGRVGRILRHVWSGKRNVLWQSGQTSQKDVVEWRPGTNWPGIQRVSSIVALWGVVPGRGNLDDNTTLALAAMDLGRALGADRVLHCSSAAVYRPGPELLTEARADPVNDYGRAKLNMEAAVLRWATQNPVGPKPVLMRIGNVVGADSLFTALDGPGPITLDRFPDGSGPRRSYVGQSALAAVLDTLCSADLSRVPNVLNVADRVPVDMADIVQSACRAFAWKAATPQANPLVSLDLTRLAALMLPYPSDPKTYVAEWRGQKAGAT